MDHLPGFAWMKDLEGRYVYLNKKEAELDVYRDGAIGKTDSELWPAEIASAYRANDQQVITTRKALQAVEPSLANGERSYMLVSKFPIFDQEGSVVMVAGAGVDITDLTQAKNALNAQALRYKTLMETSTDSICVLDGKGDLQEANAAFLSRLGYTSAEANGLNVVDFDAQWDREQLEDKRRQPFDKSAVFETRHRRKDGSVFDVEVSATSVQIGDEQLFFCVTRDITERKRVEQSQRESQLRYETLVQSIDGIVWEADPKTFMFTFVSKQAEKILGYPLEQWFEGPGFWPDHMHPGDRDWAVKFCVDATARGEDHQFEYRMISADGRVVWLNDIVSLDVAADQSATLRGLMVDITERKLADQALRESETKFRRLLGSNIVGVVFWTIQGDILDANDLFLKMIDYTREDLRQGNLDWTSLTPPEYAGVDEKAVGELLTTGTCRPFEKEYIRKDGSRLSVLIGSALLDDQKQTGSSFVMDITERKQAEDALRRSEEKFKTLFGIAPVGISVLDRQHNVIDANPALERITRLRREELLNEKHPHRTILKADGTPMLPAEFPSERAMTENRPVHDAEAGVVLENGEIIWVQVSVAPLALPEASAVVITQDMTERKRAVKELQEANDQLQILSRRLFQVQEDEKRHMARELHDEIGQALTAAKINLQSAQRVDDPADLARRLDESIGILDGLLQQTRRLSLDLRPPLLDDLGLVPTLRSYVDEQAQRAGFRVTFFADPRLERLSAEIETACFRVAQQALTNATRHAQARNVNVELHLAPQALHLIVRDDGAGFDVKAAEERGRRGESFGLPGMRERLSLVGGELDLKSILGRGTEVHAFLPLGIDSHVSGLV
jgi:PAS domain S-box-containing protein